MPNTIMRKHKLPKLKQIQKIFWNIYMCKNKVYSIEVQRNNGTLSTTDQETATTFKQLLHHRI